jgi:organic hydroperoxide reductase OsmC/OhrA
MNDSKIRTKSKKFISSVNIKLTGKGKGVIEASEKPDIELSAPVEFGGIKGLWTPEDLFVASVNACLMTTFSHYAKKKNFSFVSFESSAEGILELVEMRYVFGEIKVKPKIVVSTPDDIKVAERILNISQKVCVISNSIKPKLILEPEIVTDQ